MFGPEEKFTHAVISGSQEKNLIISIQLFLVGIESEEIIIEDSN